MARIVEDTVDSDDEFPDLAQLLKNVKAAPKTRGKTADTSRDAGALEATPENEGRPRRDRGKRRGVATSSETLGRDEEKELVVNERATATKPRKRILNRKSDNPLLRPLPASVRSRPSPDLEDGTMRVKAKELKLRESVKIESKAVDSGLDEEPAREKLPARRKEARKVVSKPKEALRLELEDEDYDLKGRSKEVGTKDPKPVSRAGSACPDNESPKSRKTLKSKHLGIQASDFTKGLREDSTCQEDPPAKGGKLLKSKVLKNPAPGATNNRLSEHFSDEEDSSACLHNQLAETKPSQSKVKIPAPKLKKQHLQSFGSDDEEDYDSDGLSDFVVNDSTFLEEESVVVPAPRSVRRLVKGRKPRKDDSEDDLDLKMDKLTVNDDPFALSREASWEKDLLEFADNYEAGLSPPLPKLPTKFPAIQREGERKDRAPSRPPTSGSEIDNPFTLKFSPPPQPLKTTKTTRFTTPPGSPEPPRPRGLISPTKLLQRIPATPHRQSMDAFWQQDVINDWNDEYSPRKPPAPPVFSPTKAKLSPVKPDKAAKDAKKAFEDSKHAIAENFLFELDKAITAGKVAELANTTGGIKIIWSNKLNTTAGRANWKRETIRSKVPGTQPPQVTITHRHHASIELASKVITTNSRLLNVIAHEFCHLTNFMISNMKTNPHGKEFKAWARSVTAWGQSQGLGKPGKGKWGVWEDDEPFEVTTKHSYEIDYKFVWQCSACGVLYQRHSRSVDPARHQCGTCRGKLLQIRPVPRGGGPAGEGVGEGKGKDGAGEKKGLSEYQLFVRENMKLVKQANPGSPQKEIMGLVGRRYREWKAEKAGGVVESVEVGDDLDGGVGDDEVDVAGGDNGKDVRDEDLGGVVRKLKFLDLTAGSD